MKKLWTMTALLALIISATASTPTRIALLDFEDETSGWADAKLGGNTSSTSLANKGVYVLGSQLMDSDAGYSLIDRREFVAQVEALQPRDMGEATPTKPSFIQAAQALNADMVLRGVLMSFSTGKQKVNQGGYQTDFTALTISVSLQALDAVDGGVIAMSNGSATHNFRQTAALSTELGDDDVMLIMEEAVKNALPKLEASLAKRTKRLEAREKVRLAIKSTADPCLVEIDGILVGSTPIEDITVYKGDHVLMVGRPGYEAVTKRILMNRDMSVTVPMLKVDLDADQWKEVLESSRLWINVGNTAPSLIIEDFRN